jgi:hypothetical protein
MMDHIVRCFYHSVKDKRIVASGVSPLIAQAPATTLFDESSRGKPKAENNVRPIHVRCFKLQIQLDTASKL